MTSAYELALNLKPRYAKDGDTGEYMFRFVIRVRLSNRKYLDMDKDSAISEKKRAYISTVLDNATMRMIHIRVDEVRKILEDIWSSTVRENFLKRFSAGATGLGKRNR